MSSGHVSSVYTAYSCWSPTAFPRSQAVYWMTSPPNINKPRNGAANAEPCQNWGMVLLFFYFILLFLCSFIFLLFHCHFDSKFHFWHYFRLFHFFLLHFIMHFTYISVPSSWKSQQTVKKRALNGKTSFALETERERRTANYIQQ